MVAQIVTAAQDTYSLACPDITNRHRAPKSTPVLHILYGSKSPAEKKSVMNRHFQASWASQPMWCLLLSTNRIHFMRLLWKHYLNNFSIRPHSVCTVIRIGFSREFQLGYCKRHISRCHLWPATTIKTNIFCPINVEMNSYSLPENCSSPKWPIRGLCV